MAWYDEAVFYHIYPLGLTGAPKENPYGECNASGTRSSYVTATKKDGEKQAVCGVNISFKTMDAKGWWVQ